MGKFINKSIKDIRRNKMNIAIYTNILDNGGISKFVYNLQEAFEKKNVKSNIVTFYADTIYGDNITLLNCSNHLNRIKNLRNYIKKNKIEAIISNTWFETFIAKVASLFCGNNVKVISVVHIRPNLWGFKENDIIRRLFSKLALNSSYKVIAVSNELKDAMIEEKWVKNNKIATIYNPVIFDDYKESKNIMYKDIENKENIEVAIIGWIQPRKAQDIVVKAFNCLKDKSYTLNFIGGVDEQSYNNQVLDLINKFNLQDKVKFWGVRKDIFHILKEMDVLISASRGEALPTVMIEALYLEIPIISSDCDYGPKEILKNGEYGLIFKVDDYENLAKCFERLVNDNELYNKFISTSKERSKLFTFDKAVDSYLNILNK